MSLIELGTLIALLFCFSAFVYVVWRIFQANRGNWVMTFGILAIALLFFWGWTHEFLPSQLSKYVLTATWGSAFLGLFFALKRLFSWLQKITVKDVARWAGYKYEYFRSYNERHRDS